MDKYKESKYKSGDKVKIPCMDRCGELIGIENNGRWRILLDDGTFAFVFESEFKPVENSNKLKTDMLSAKEIDALLYGLDKMEKEDLSPDEVAEMVSKMGEEDMSVVHKGERYNPSKVDGIVKTFTEQIRVAYERGYKDGNFDGQTYAYNKGYADGRSEQHKEDSTYNTYLRGYNDAIDDIMKRAREMSGKVVKNDE